MSKRTTTIQLRVTPPEKKLMTHAANGQGLSLSAWIRLALMSASLKHLANEEDAKKKAKR